MSRVGLRTVSRRRLQSTDFAVIANNCWAGALYDELDVEYNTPFVGLFILPDDYLHLLTNFHELIHLPLEFVDAPRESHPSLDGQRQYPIGRLVPEVEIHFLHYGSVEEARQKWDRRRKRLTRVAPDRLFVKFCDHDGCSEEQVARFEALEHFPRRVFFTAQPRADCDSAVSVPSNETASDGTPRVVDGFKLWGASRQYFDAIGWLNGTDGTPSGTYRKVVSGLTVGRRL